MLPTADVSLENCVCWRVCESSAPRRVSFGAAQARDDPTSGSLARAAPIPSDA